MEKAHTTPSGEDRICCTTISTGNGSRSTDREIRCTPRSGCSRRMPGYGSVCTGFPVWQLELPSWGIHDPATGLSEQSGNNFPGEVCGEGERGQGRLQKSKGCIIDMTARSPCAL
ncbi:hypothetical protein An14g05230 [Aspergillus niger]|uniref:Uncharacterized protein n=2 Tax=Aspergillus niger TaxID=5061 RepID=A2R3R6_ASPNC|nr:hypothetical protein An14g05230 [Aspergillus niger]CAK42084.1 hypothetical protein An14g05230 [Aspergillus niger]